MIVTLSGFMKCGKSTLGRRAAELLGWQFIDLDVLIEAKYGPIDDIFSLSGESFFRHKESELLKEVLSTSTETIISLGGGTPLSKENISLIRDYALNIWINTPLTLILEGITSDTSLKNRPLIKGKSIDEIKALYFERLPLYRSGANKIIDVKMEDTVENVSMEIAKIVRQKA